MWLFAYLAILFHVKRDINKIFKKTEYKCNKVIDREHRLIIKLSHFNLIAFKRRLKKAKIQTGNLDKFILLSVPDLTQPITNESG